MKEKNLNDIVVYTKSSIKKDFLYSLEGNIFIVSDIDFNDKKVQNLCELCDFYNNDKCCGHTEEDFCCNIPLTLIYKNITDKL